MKLSEVTWFGITKLTNLLAFGHGGRGRAWGVFWERKVLVHVAERWNKICLKLLFWLSAHIVVGSVKLVFRSSTSS